MTPQCGPLSVPSAMCDTILWSSHPTQDAVLCARFREENLFAELFYMWDVWQVSLLIIRHKFLHKHLKPMPRERSLMYHNFCLCCMCPIEYGMSTVMVWHNYLSYFRSESQWVKVWVKIEVTWPMHRARIIWWTKKLLRDHASIMLEGILWHVISK